MPSAPTGRSTAEKLLVGGGVLIVAAVALGWYLMVATPPGPSRGGLDEARQFGMRVTKGDPTARRQLLGPEAAFDLTPVSADEAERRVADFYLRHEGLAVVEVLPGVPDGTGKQKEAPGRFTLVTRGTAATPSQVVRTARGVQPPANVNLVNPDVVVEFVGGKIVGVRCELPMR